KKAAEKEERRRNLSAQLSQEYSQNEQQQVPASGLLPFRSLGASAGILAGTLLLGSALVFASTMHVAPPRQQFAAVSQTESPFFGTQSPTVNLSTNLPGKAMGGAVTFLSNVFSLLFGHQTQVAQNTQAEPA